MVEFARHLPRAQKRNSDKLLFPDGKYFFFSSGRRHHPDYSKTAITYREKIVMMNSWGNGRNEDIYWDEARIIDNLRSR